MSKNREREMYDTEASYWGPADNSPDRSGVLIVVPESYAVRDKPRREVHIDCLQAG